MTNELCMHKKIKYENYKIIENCYKIFTFDLYNTPRILFRRKSPLKLGIEAVFRQVMLYSVHRQKKTHISL